MQQTNDWKPTDEITTTVGTIWNTQADHFDQGVATERERIIALIKCVEGTDWLIDLIRGKADNE